MKLCINIMYVYEKKLNSKEIGRHLLFFVIICVYVITFSRRIFKFRIPAYLDIIIYITYAVFVYVFLGN